MDIETAYRERIDAMSVAEKVRRAEELFRWSRDYLLRSIVASPGRMSDDDVKWEIALRQYGSEPATRGIFVMGATGESPRRIVEPAAWESAWSPDGRSLAYSTAFWPNPYSRSSKGELWIVDVASRERARPPSGQVLRKRGIARLEQRNAGGGLAHLAFRSSDLPFRAQS